jgi:hypothetical protein
LSCKLAYDLAVRLFGVTALQLVRVIVGRTAAHVIELLLAGAVLDIEK